MIEFYNSNEDFRRYVDRYCKAYRIAVNDALEHELVKQVAAQYMEKEETK